ncbi:hypothetical protein DEO72_LG10g1033 [Vigna unguiculata]|uniref:Uncharacterized protein n=1 Tax=Vigna unguiculata TaxID=3917 RepID=A0A4D6N7L0_VIGUN|nr:hypothetical protein DEO72_LG10g1033 [Vigna unguiculata]
MDSVNLEEETLHHCSPHRGTCAGRSSSSLSRCHPLVHFAQQQPSRQHSPSSLQLRQSCRRRRQSLLKASPLPSRRPSFVILLLVRATPDLEAMPPSPIVALPTVIEVVAAVPIQLSFFCFDWCRFGICSYMLCLQRM